MIFVLITSTPLPTIFHFSKLLINKHCFLDKSGNWVKQKFRVWLNFFFFLLFIQLKNRSVLHQLVLILSQVDYRNRMMQRLNESYPNYWLVLYSKDKNYKDKEEDKERVQSFPFYRIHIKFKHSIMYFSTLVE